MPLPPPWRAAGVSLPPERLGDGVDLVPYLVGTEQSKPHDALFVRMRQRCALRVDDWKLVYQPAYGKKEAQWQLYDLATDIGESLDLAGEQPETAAKLVSQWEQINEGMQEPFWSPRR